MHITVGIFRRLSYTSSAFITKDFFALLLPSGQQGPGWTLPLDPYSEVPKQSSSPSVPLPSTETPSAKPKGVGNCSPLLVLTISLVSSLAISQGSKFIFAASRNRDLRLSWFWKLSLTYTQFQQYRVVDLQEGRPNVWSKQVRLFLSQVLIKISLRCHNSNENTIFR